MTTIQTCVSRFKMSNLVRHVLRIRSLRFPVSAPCTITSLPTATSRCATLILPPVSKSSFHTSTITRKTFEPDYLDTEGLSIPMYPPLNIQLKGYNFDVLEQFQSWVHQTVENMGVDVSEAWATPAQTYSMSTYQEGGVRPKDTYKIHLYERNVQVTNLRSVDATILIDLIQRALPEGVEFSLHEHTVEAEERRWIADPFIDSLRKELSEGQEEKDILAAKKEKEKEAKEARKKEMILKTLLEDS